MRPSGSMGRRRWLLHHEEPGFRTPGWQAMPSPKPAATPRLATNVIGAGRQTARHVHDSVYFFLSGSGGLTLASTDRTPGDQSQAAQGRRARAPAPSRNWWRRAPARHRHFLPDTLRSSPTPPTPDLTRLQYATASAPHHAAGGSAGRRRPASYDGDVGSATAGHRAALRTNDVDVPGLVLAIPYRL